MKALFFSVFSILTVSLFAQGVISVEKDNIYTLSMADLSFSVDAEKGGRIVSFQRAGKEILLQQDIHPVYYGSTLWPSPQKDFWPPSAILDKKPYIAEIIGNRLRIGSNADTILGFRFVKEFFCLPDTSVSINYIIENISKEKKKVAAWDVTRVVPGGCVYFPVEKIIEASLENITIKNDTLRYICVPDSSASKQKLFATLQQGWLAHENNGLIFIKQIPVTPEEDLPTMQGTVEIFCAPKSQYLELESHGKYTELKPGEQLSYKQQWQLKALNSIFPHSP